MTKTWCDKCGCEIVTATQQVDVLFKFTCPERVVKKVNLCPTCTEKRLIF